MFYRLFYLDLYYALLNENNEEVSPGFADAYGLKQNLSSVD
jgi:hypothetical protein